MKGFAYRINPERSERVDIAAALDPIPELVWVHLFTIDDDARSWLADHAKLSPQTVEALTAPETRPRCDQWEGGALVNLRGRTDQEEVVGTDLLASLRIWATHGRIFSVTRTQLHALDAIEACVAADKIHDPGDLIAEFAAAITSDLDPHVAELGDRLDMCEESLEGTRIFELRRQVTRVRSTAIGYRRFLGPQRDALEKLAGLPGDWLAADDRVHLSAAADRAARMAEELEAIRERSAVVHDALTDMRAEQLDQRGLILSVAALIFLPLTFLTGLYGMNVEGLRGAKNPHAFDIITGVCLLIAVAITVFFVVRRWTSR
ncbi:CorA family divalent cation transporter [uncultured Sphingomonas sp.]|uniref:CorA family divalent cation transporter n=1 Tax=uncultured Sphingomonas sp. TaxID=158754 RepID=UPI0035C9A48E